MLGVRGTGLYLEADEKKTYLCTCYGTVDVHPAYDPKAIEQIKTYHHEKPRYIYADPQKTGITTKGPMLNHTDAELMRLESMVGRKPLFYKISHKKEGNGGNGGGY